MSLVMQIGDGPVHGAHRLTVTAEASAERWAIAAKQLALDIHDSERAGAWNEAVQMELVGWSPAPEGARFFLAGNAMTWVALASGGYEVPVLAHMTIALGVEPAALRLESRSLGKAVYERVVGLTPWPFAIEGTRAFRRVRVQAETDIGPAERRGLADMLRPLLRREAWARGEIPGAEQAFCEGEWVVLPRVVERSELLEVVYVWAQVFWVNIKRVHFAAL